MSPRTPSFWGHSIEDMPREELIGLIERLAELLDARNLEYARNLRDLILAAKASKDSEIQAHRGTVPCA